MSTLEHQPDLVELVETEPDGNSLMGRLRRKRATLAAQRTIDLPIAGYGGDLVARYRLLDPLVEGKEIARRVAEQFPREEAEQAYYGLVDALIEGCVGLYARTHGELIALDDESAFGAMTYSDSRLGEFLDFEAEEARQAVLEVFAGNKNAVTAHAVELQKWFADTSGELNTRSLGVG